MWGVHYVYMCGAWRVYFILNTLTWSRHQRSRQSTHNIWYRNILIWKFGNPILLEIIPLVGSHQRDHRWNWLYTLTGFDIDPWDCPSIRLPLLVGSMKSVTCTFFCIEKGMLKHVPITTSVFLILPDRFFFIICHYSIDATVSMGYNAFVVSLGDRPMAGLRTLTPSI